MLVPPEIFQEEAADNVYSARLSACQPSFTHKIGFDTDKDLFYITPINGDNPVAVLEGTVDDGLVIEHPSMVPGDLLLLGSMRRQLDLRRGESRFIYAQGLVTPLSLLITGLDDKRASLTPLEAVLRTPRVLMPEKTRQIFREATPRKVGLSAWILSCNGLVSLKEAAHR